MKSQKLEVANLISIGVFTAIYFVLVAIATFGSALILPGFSNILLPAISALISGTIYMLMVAKIQKFGGITIMGIVMGVFFFISGHFIISFAANIICGIVADIIGKTVQYKNKVVILISYVIFSYGLTGPIIPLWFMKDAYVENLTARGKDTIYIENLFANINMGTFWICIAAILICAVAGGMFGQKMLKKHFEKVGIV